jgi:hypothetical protein
VEALENCMASSEPERLASTGSGTEATSGVSPEEELDSLSRQLSSFRPQDPVLRAHARVWQKQMMGVQTRLVAVRSEVDDLIAAGDFVAASIFVDSARADQQCAGAIAARSLDAIGLRVTHGFWQDTQQRVAEMMGRRAYSEALAIIGGALASTSMLGASEHEGVLRALELQVSLIFGRDQLMQLCLQQAALLLKQAQDIRKPRHYVTHAM